MIIDVRICRPKCPKTRFSVTLSLQPWGPETFHARFPVLVSLYSYPLRHSWLRPKNCQPAAKTKHSTAHQKKKYWYSGSGAHNLSIAGLHVTSRRPCWWPRTKAYLSSGMLTPIHVNSSRKIYCFDLQHGRLVT